MVSAKSPVAVMLVNVSVLVPLLVTVTDWDALEVPATWLPKLRLEGERLTPGAVPVPDNARTSWPLAVPSV